MIPSDFLVNDPAEVGLDPDKVSALLERAEKEVKLGILPSCQIAIARKGRIGAMKTFGKAVQRGQERPATNETCYVVFSATKAIVSAAAWLLIEQGKLDVSLPVVNYVPEFGTNGKDAVKVEQLFVHTGGFPDAPYPQQDWLDRQKRLERFKSWRLQRPAGSKFIYHPTSSFWVIGEILERLSGMDFRDFIYGHVSQPLGLPDLRMGISRQSTTPVADLVAVGEPLKPEDYKQMGFPVPVQTEVTDTAILGFNDPAVREAGVPGGGGVMSAGDLALFYQVLLAEGRTLDGRQIWKPQTIRDALRIRTEGYKDPVFGYPVKRGLGLVLAGDDEFANLRGFGRTNSPTAFGHGGAGGQLGWGDPQTGISLGYCTNGYDLNDIRQGRRGVAISSLAAVCAEGKNSPVR